MCRIQPRISHISSIPGDHMEESIFLKSQILRIVVNLWLIRPRIRQILRCFLNLLFVSDSGLNRSQFSTLQPDGQSQIQVWYVNGMDVTSRF